MSNIESIDDIITLMGGETIPDWSQYGFVTVRRFDDLLVFSYNTMAQYSETWNFFESVSRGLIINWKTYEIVARPFDKFFNWGEGGRVSTAPIVSLTEKMDGSLGILYRLNGDYKIATRGSLNSEQAIWATTYLNKHYQLDDLPQEITLLFEIIYPENRIVVDYQGREDLVLLAARNRFTGEYLPITEVKNYAERYGFNLVKIYESQDLEEILKQLEQSDGNFEGYVAEFADGQRFKLKGKRYLELHKLISSLSFKNVLKAMQNNNLAQILETIPDEFLNETKGWIAEIENTLASEQSRLQAIFEQAPKANRKEFALWVMANHKQDSRYLFALLDEIDIIPLLYRYYAWGHEEEETESL